MSINSYIFINTLVWLIPKNSKLPTHPQLCAHTHPPQAMRMLIPFPVRVGSPTSLHLFWEIVVFLLCMHSAPYNLLIYVFVRKSPMNYLRWGPYLLHLSFGGYELEADYSQSLTARQVSLFLLGVLLPWGNCWQCQARCRLLVRYPLLYSPSQISVFSLY